jgi:hypothetical protein
MKPEMAVQSARPFQVLPKQTIHPFELRIHTVSDLGLQKRNEVDTTSPGIDLKKP